MTSIETVRTDSFSMDYFRFGHGKRNLVIIPGLSVQSVMGSANEVENAYDAMTEDFTVYVFDRRRELPLSYSVNEMAVDTAAAMRAAGIDRACIFGASQGGMIAMRIAIDDPGLVEKLVLASSCARVTDEKFSVISDWISLAVERNAEKLYLAFGEALYPRTLFEGLRSLLAESAKTVTNEDLSRFVILARALKDFDVTQDLTKISCPVFLLADSEDRVLGPDAAESIGDLLKGRADFEQYTYNGYGHALYDAAPDFKERILDFLRRDRSS